MEQTFFVAGGDARQEAIIHQLKEAGRSVSAFGFQAADHLTPEIAAHLGAADIILLPLPAADSDNCLNAPSMEKRLPMEMLWSLLHLPRSLLRWHLLLRWSQPCCRRMRSWMLPSGLP